MAGWAGLGVKAGLVWGGQHAQRSTQFHTADGSFCPIAKQRASIACAARPPGRSMISLSPRFITRPGLGFSRQAPSLPRYTPYTMAAAGRVTNSRFWSLQVQHHPPSAYTGPCMQRERDGN